MDYTGDMKRILKTYFGHNSFLMGQKEVIESILEGRNTIAIFPTGGGKSLCYQLPALIFPGTTIVISPLISLMKDQVDELTKLNINAAYISSILSDRQVTRTIRDMKRGKYKIVYIAPERFYSEDFCQPCRRSTCPFVAVDEAHCISQWGIILACISKDKESYSYISNPILAAFTATATKRVQNDIVNLLGMKENCNVFVESFDRPNLEFKVERCEDKWSYILKHIQKNRHKPESFMQPPG